jgi:Putative MetA-pathway of phenol degradation
MPLERVASVLWLVMCVITALVVSDPGTVAGQGLMTVPIGFRSGFTEGAVTTRRGSVAFDGGISMRRARGVTTYRVGEFSVRLPLTDRLEARAYANSYTWRQAPSGSYAGREDLSLAMAAMLVTHRGIRPVATLIVRVETPTGTLPTREHTWRPSARCSLGWELPGRIALHSNVGVAHETLGGEHFAREFASVWLSRHLAGPLGLYGEVYGSTQERPGGGATRYLHGGLTYLIRSWLHVDVHAGLGSRSAASPRWVGVGFRQRT